MKTFEQIRTYVLYERAKNTDKFYSGFARFYFDRFNNKRTEIKSLLEIGVNRGGSSLFWKDLFVNAEIYGIDILPRVTRYVEDRIHMAVVNQSKSNQLKEYAESSGPWDIIVDDGSHKVSHQVISFETLWPYVNNGGQYIIEDIETSTNPMYIPKYVDMDLNFVEYCKNIQANPPPDVDSIEFLKNMIIFNKK